MENIWTLIYDRKKEEESIRIVLNCSLLDPKRDKINFAVFFFFHSIFLFPSRMLF